MDRSLPEVIFILLLVSGQFLFWAMFIGVFQYANDKRCSVHTKIKILKWKKAEYPDLPPLFMAECTYDNGNKEFLELDGMQNEIMPDRYKEGDTFEIFLDPKDKKHYKINNSFSFVPYIRGGIIGSLIAFFIFSTMVYFANR